MEVKVDEKDPPFKFNEEEGQEEPPRSPNLKMRRIESKILKEYDDVYDNKRLSMVSTIQVFQKAGSYIVHMGLVNFFEYLVINLMLILHTAKKEERARD